jgi:hypothetical protein
MVSLWVTRHREVDVSEMNMKMIEGWHVMNISSNLSPKSNIKIKQRKIVKNMKVKQQKTNN